MFRVFADQVTTSQTQQTQPHARVLQYSNNFQYLMHTSINYYDIGIYTYIICALDHIKPSVVVYINVKILGFSLFRQHSFEQLYFVDTEYPQYTPALVQNKLLVMSMSSLLSKDHILVYRDMLSISTPDINFRIPPNFTTCSNFLSLYTHYTYFLIIKKDCIIWRLHPRPSYLHILKTPPLSLS